MKRPEIDPVEATMAVIGLRAIISKKVEKVTKGTLDRVDGLEKDVTRLSRQLVNDRLTEGFYSDLDHRQMLHDLSAGVDLHQIEAMANAFPAEYRTLGHALVASASHVIQALMNMFPTSSYQTVAGSTSLLPDDVKLWKFVSILEVLDNPLLVFPLMATGALLRSQARAVRTLYPTLADAIDQAIFEATVKAKAKRKSFELTHRAEVGVKAWMDQPPMSPAALRSSQAAVQKSKDKQEARKQAAKSKTSSMDSTQAQRSDPGTT